MNYNLSNHSPVSWLRTNVLQNITCTIAKITQLTNGCGMRRLLFILVGVLAETQPPWAARRTGQAQMSAHMRSSHI